MTTSASEIDALKQTIADFEKDRKDLKSQRDIATKAKQTLIDKRIIALDNQTTAARNTLNLLLAAQQQGKFPLSFSFLFFSSIIFFYQSHKLIMTYRFGSASVTVGKGFEIDCNVSFIVPNNNIISSPRQVNCQLIYPLSISCLITICFFL